MDQGFTYEQLKAMYDAAGAFSNGHADPNAPWELPTPLVDWPAAYGLGEDPARWLARPLIPEQGAVAIFAKGGTGKSLLALWIAAGVATGHGLGGDVDPADVLYLDYEMTVRDVVDRLEDMGYDDPDALGRLHYASLPTLPPLDTAAGGRAVTDMAQHLKVSLVVIDTFGRAVDGEEDRADTVRAWYRWTGQLLKTAGIGFLRIDHAGKDVKRGQRGTSAKNDDVDIVWEMADRGHGEFLLRATKRRVSWVEERVVLTQTNDNGVLAYHWADSAVTFLAGTAEVAELLDELDAPLDISRRKAMVLLREHGHGKGNNLVADALRFRRDGAQYRVQYLSNAGVRTVGVRDPRTDPSSLVDRDVYRPVPPSAPNHPGGAPYVVGPLGGGVSGGLFDPSTDPEREGTDVPDA